MVKFKSSGFDKGTEWSCSLRQKLWINGLENILEYLRISHFALERVLLILTQFHPNPIISNEQLII